MHHIHVTLWCMYNECRTFHWNEDTYILQSATYQGCCCSQTVSKIWSSFFFSAAASCLRNIANNSFEVMDEKKIVRRKRKPGSDKRCTKAQTAKDTKDSCGQNRKTRKKIWMETKIEVTKQRTRWDARRRNQHEESYFKNLCRFNGSVTNTSVCVCVCLRQGGRQEVWAAVGLWDSAFTSIALCFSLSHIQSQPSISKRVSTFYHTHKASFNQQETDILCAHLASCHTSVPPEHRLNSTREMPTNQLEVNDSTEEKDAD